MVRVVQTTAPVAVGLAAATVLVSLAYGVAALPWGYGKPQLAALLAALALDPARGGGGWHGLVTHPLLHVRVAHLVGTVGVLLAFGTAVERAVGTPRFLLAWAAGGLAAAGAAAVWGLVPTTGGTAGALAVLGVALVVDGRARAVGPLSGRVAAAVAAGGLVTLTAALEWTGGEWHYATHLLALPLGVAGAAAPPVFAWWRLRRWVRRGLASLAAEHDARERVEALLGRIGEHGLASLTGAERRFLRRASRYFVAGRTHDTPATDPRRAVRPDVRAPRPPAE